MCTPRTPRIAKTPRPDYTLTSPRATRRLEFNRLGSIISKPDLPLVVSGVEENGRTVTGAILGGTILGSTMRALILLATLFLATFFGDAVGSTEGVVASWLEDQAFRLQSFGPLRAVESREEATCTKGASYGRPRTGYRMDESLDDVPRIHVYPAHEECGICAGTAGHRGDEDGRRHGDALMDVETSFSCVNTHNDMSSQLEQARQASMAAEKAVNEARADASKCLVAQAQAYEKAHSNNQEHERVLERVTAAFTGCQRSFASAMEKVQLERARVQIMTDHELEYLQLELADCRTSRAAAENASLECQNRRLFRQGQGKTDEKGGGERAPQHFVYKEQQKELETCRQSVDTLRASVDHLHAEIQICVEREAEATSKQQEEEEWQAREDPLLEIFALQEHDVPPTVAAAIGQILEQPELAETLTALETVDASESSGVAQNIKSPSLTIERKGHRHERGEALIPRVQGIKDKQSGVEEVSATETAWLARVEAAVASAAAAAVAARDAATAAQKTATAVSRRGQREQEAMIVTHEIELRPCAYLPTDTGKVDGCGGEGVSVVPILYNDQRFFGSESSCVSSAKWNACMQERRSKRAAEDGGGAGGSWGEDGDHDDSTDVLQCWEEAFQNKSTQQGHVLCTTIARRLQSANCQLAASSLPERVSLRRSMLLAVVYLCQRAAASYHETDI